MTKLLLLGDTHWGCNNDNPVFHRYFSKFYEFMFNYIDSNNIKTLIQLGDLFDKRKNINFVSLYESNKQFFDQCEMRSELKVFVISGNHDCTYKNTNEVNSVSLLSKPFMTVVDKVPQTINIAGADVDFYPWINESNLDDSLKLASSTESKFAVGHFEFSKFPLHKGQLAEYGMDHTLLSRYERVYSGHYHTQSQKDNVQYTGTPYELDWADYNDPKGFWILDTATGEQEFIQNPFTMYNVLVYTTDTSAIDKDGIQDKFIKVLVKDKIDQNHFDNFIDTVNSYLPISVKIVDTSISDSIEEAMRTDIEFMSTHVMLRNVVDSLDTNLDKDKLNKLITEIYFDASELAKL